MKTLILVRHAKSSWETPGQSDKERPLNERGKKDAPEMAKRLKEKNIKVDLFVSSPAKRALKTAKIFAEEFDVKKGDILEVEELYMATESAFLDTISHFDNSVAVAAVFSHNPGITEFASSLTHVKLDNMPTCSIFAVQAETDSWKDFSTAQKKFLFFDYPKKALHES